MIKDFSGQYEFLSNFSPSTVMDYAGIIYPTVEHAYQAAKTLDLQLRKKEFTTGTAAQAKKKGRQIETREDWEGVKLFIMETLLREKFSIKHPDLVLMLKETYPHELVEGNWWGDTYWGVCKGVGQNNLGKLLMKIRQELIK